MSDYTRIPQNNPSNAADAAAEAAARQATIAAQDGALDELSNVLTHLNAAGREIDSELERHTVVIDELEQGISRNQSDLSRLNSKLDTLRQKIRQNSFAVIFGGMIVAIVVLILLITLL